MKTSSRFIINEDPIFFLPTLAKTIGLNEAILLQKIHGWLQCKPRDADNKAWIYNTYKSWQEQLPFMSENTIIRTLKKLEELGIIEVGNFNKSKFDKTKWYSINYEKIDELTDFIDVPKLSTSNNSDWELPYNQFEQTYTNNNYNNNNNIYNINETSARNRFIKPALEEIQQYCLDRKNNVDAKKFFDYYEASDWRDVKGNKVKNWKQKVITWEKRNTTEPKKEVKGEVYARL